MSVERETYSQPQKKKARETVLRHTVRSLTVERASSPLVPVSMFDSLARYCVDFIRDHVRLDLSEPMRALRDHWEMVHASRVGRRAPSDLKVLFLCGPEPFNDLDELVALGVAPENVWAIEGDERAFKEAARQLREEGRPIKLHQGSLHEFLAVVPEQFDIVYFDDQPGQASACPQAVQGERERVILGRQRPRADRRPCQEERAMTHTEAFLQAIQEDPADDTPAPHLRRLAGGERRRRPRQLHPHSDRERSSNCCGRIGRSG
jgi:hypothetical protein